LALYRLGNILPRLLPWLACQINIQAPTKLS
jgi:hypothetical protein